MAGVSALANLAASHPQAAVAIAQAAAESPGAGGASPSQQRQHQQKRGKAGRGTPAAGGILSALDFTTACMSGDDEVVSDDELEGEGYINDAARQAQSLRLRMYIYAGEHLPRMRSKVAINVNAGTENEKEIFTPTAAESEHPLWQFTLDEIIQMSGHTSRLDLKVYGERLVGDKLIGTCTLSLPGFTMDSPKKQELRLHTGSLMNWGSTRPAKLVVVWQMCHEGSYAIDLNRVAAMDSSDMEKMAHTVTVKLLRLSLNHASPQQKVGVTFKLTRLDKDMSITREAPIILTTPTPEEGEMSAQEALLSCRQAVWTSDETGAKGYDLDPWNLHESKVTLMNWFLEITVFSYQIKKQDSNANIIAKGGKSTMAKLRSIVHRGEVTDTATVIGSWREPLSDLLQVIDGDGHALHCNADLGVKVGVISMELDVFDDQPHRSLLALSGAAALSNSTSNVPVRRGMPPESKWQDKVRYCVSAFADGLPIWRDCRPYIRISMGCSTAITEVLEEHTTNDVTWKEPLVIDTTRFYRKATVELFHCMNKSGVPSVEHDLLLGEQTIYDVSHDKEYWIHFFGGAHDPPNQDIAMNMVRSAVRPASTYQTTVSLIFGTKRQSKAEILARITSKRRQRRLVVRLHRGLYLPERFRGKKVTILCQVAGCRLPDLHEAQRLLKLREAVERARQTGSVADQEEAAKLEREPADPVHLNRNVLSFQGEVNDAGMLCFFHATQPGAAPEKCSWVELTTIKDFPLDVPLNVNHVYLYVVVAGQEKEPPQLFSRLRINLRPPSDPDAMPPRWRRLRFDRSVTEISPTMEFPNNFSGFMLGSAALVMPEPGDANSPPTDMSLFSHRGNDTLLPEAVAKPWVCTPAWSPTVWTLVGVGSRGDPRESTCVAQQQTLRKTVYCYVDFLAARDLPAMDQDGLMDPSYSIRVLDKEIIVPAGFQKTTSPTFMHRAVIPFEVEVVAGPNPESILVASRSPFPPVIVTIMDYDPSQSVFESDKFEHVGLIVVKHMAIVGKSGKLVYPTLDYNAETAQATAEGAEFTTAPKTLDLNKVHQASWYSLDAPGKAPFDPSAGGVDKSWHSRPRVLVAVGYSLKEQKDPSMFGKKLPISQGSAGDAYAIECVDKACYQLDLDLLGLRNLPPHLSHPRLCISSFWDGPRVEFDIGPAKDHNFLQEGSGPEHERELADFAKKMSRLLRIKATSEEEDHRAERVVLYEELCGVRVKAPLYRVPVIPYLQTQVIQPGRWLMREVGTKHIISFDLAYSNSKGMLEGKQIRQTGVGAKGIVEQNMPIFDGRIHNNHIEFRVQDLVWKGILKDQGKSITNLECCPIDADESKKRNYTGEWKQSASNPFVLLPAVTFELSHAMTGLVYLTLTVGLNRLLLASGGTRLKTWTEVCLEEMLTVPKNLRMWSYQAEGMLSLESAAHEDPGSKDPLEIGGAEGVPSPRTRRSPRHSGARTGAIVPVPNISFREDAYETFVDVFAAKAGYLTWDQDFRIGRPLQDQCLFYLDDELPALDSEVTNSDKAVPQYFNPGDWMFRGYDGPFDMRATPSLACHTFQIENIRKSLMHQDSSYMSSIHNVPGIHHHPSLEKARHQVRNALKRVNDLLKPDPSTISLPEKPMGPRELFKHVVSPSELRSMSTFRLKERVKEQGYRCVTHLCAPEKNKLDGQVLGTESLGANLHTFMRPVGHIVTSKDRDSRILARLRVSLPLHALEDLKTRLQDALEFDAQESVLKELKDEEERWSSAGSSTVNFLVVKFKLSGMVIWTAPKENLFWGRPGAPLFAIRLTDNPDVVVPVVVPSFDIRRKQETAWYPAKTLTTRSSTLRNRINRQIEGTSKVSQNRRWNRAKAVRLQNAECPSNIDMHNSLHDKGAVESDIDDGFDPFQPDGWTRPVRVSKSAFVCRLRHRSGGVAYDRVQTKNWYRTTMEEAFPELKAQNLDADDEHAHKSLILSRFMNVRNPLVQNVHRTTIGVPPMLKGNISVTRVSDPERQPIDRQNSDDPEFGSPLSMCTAPKQVDATGRSLDNLWVSENVFVRVFVLSAHKLDLSVLGVAGSIINFTPFIALQLGEHKAPGAVVENCDFTGGYINFYQKFDFTATFPGSAMLNFELKQKGLVGDTSIGTVSIDLEDRILTMRRRQLREATSKSILEKSVSPKQVETVKKEREIEEPGWLEPISPEEDMQYGLPLKPHSGIPDPSPIEIVDLIREDEETNGEDKAGQLRLWIDVMPIGAHVPEDPDVFFNKDFEIRITIYDIQNISIFRDFGERNDVYIKSAFKATDYNDKSVNKHQLTDTHKYARKTASFNWNMAFKCTAPSMECELEFTLMDMDKFGENDMIYFPKIYSLDQHVALAYQAWREGQPALPTLTETIVFDRWPKVESAIPKVSCGCVRRVERRLNANKNFARMKIGIQILPKDVADEVPFQTGQFHEPRGRFSYINAIENPNATAKMMLGPTRYMKLRMLIGFNIVLIFLLMISALLFYILQVRQMAVHDQ